MAEANDSTDEAKEDIEAIKSDIERLIKRLSNLKDKGGDVMTEQLTHLTDAIASLKEKGGDKGKAILSELNSSTQNHPLRNLLCAAGIGAVIAFIIS